MNKGNIICKSSPKSRRKRSLLGSKKNKSNCDSVLDEIKKLSVRKWDFIDGKTQLNSGTKKTPKKLNSFSLEKDNNYNNSVIILSDNEDDTNITKKEKQKCNNIMENKKNNSDCSNDVKTIATFRFGTDKPSKISVRSSKRLSERKESETETRKGTKRKYSCMNTSGNNTSCYIIEDSEELNNQPTTINIDEENISPSTDKPLALGSKEESDDVVMVWSSTETIPDDKLFTIDRTSNMNNLRYLIPDHEHVAKRRKKRETKQNGEEEGYLPFSRPGLKLSKSRKVKKSLRIRQPKLVIDKSDNSQPTGKFSVVSSCSAFPQSTAFSAATSTVFPSSELFPPAASMPYCTNTTGIFPSTSSASGPPVWPTNREPPVWVTTCDAPLRTASNVDSNVYCPQRRSPPRNGLREIVIDGNNVAMSHRNEGFSEMGLKLVIDFFRQRGHSVKAFVPQNRRCQEHQLLEKMAKEGIVIFTPSRKVDGKRITPYDDRYILQYATMCGGVVISSDQYRDLFKEKPEWRDTIRNRLLAPTFVGDCVMFPEDPLGRSGPTLDDFLRH